MRDYGKKIEEAVKADPTVLRYRELSRIAYPLPHGYLSDETESGRRSRASFRTCGIAVRPADMSGAKAVI